MFLGQWRVACLAQVREAQRTYNYDDSAQGKTLADGIAKSGAHASLIDLIYDEDEITKGLEVAATSDSTCSPEDLI